MPAPKFHAQSLTELIALRESTQPDDAAVHTGAAEFGDQLLTLTYSDIGRAVDRLAAHYDSLKIALPSEPDSIPPEQVIAVLTSTAIDESLLELALCKLALTPLLLSVNNSTAAVAHLCKQTKSTHLIYGTKFESTARDAQAALEKEGYIIGIVPDQRFPLWGKGGVREVKIPPFPARLKPEQESSRIGVILHSSGSTGFPKPVYITNLGLIANCAQSLPKTGFSALPLFHGFGHYSIFRCIYHGKTFTLMPPNLPLTAANICKTIRESPTPPVQHFAVPYVLKLLAESDEGIQTLADFEAVSFAGAAVPDDLGDRLAEAGVNLISFYGTTETGAIMTSRRNDYKSDKGWNWLRAEGAIAEYLELIPQGGDTFEVVVKDGWPGKVVSNREDGAYCTKDLVLRHPEHPTWYKYIGRLDDTLTQTLGEKTNPVPIELAIRGNSPLVQECIVFGDARPQTGALILPSRAGEELSRNKAEFIKTLWPIIAEANAAAPSHSRILPEMVEILPYGTEIPVATKMSILRPACYKKFASIIEDIYERFERGTGEPKKIITSQTELEAFLTETIITALGEKTSSGLGPNTDLFEFGVDSLQATRVRNVITKSLELGDIHLGQNVVYEHPSISLLAKYILDLQSGNLGKQDQSEAHQQMKALVDKFAAQIIPAKAKYSKVNASADPSAEEVIVLTGATGSLGAHILENLVNRREVSKVICLSRAGSDAESLSRVQSSLSQRQRILSPQASAKIISFAADVNKADLGLAPEQLEMIRTQATGYIHNAWPVNFVLSLPSFEPHIGGAVNLLNLAQTSPKALTPAFFFSSSVGTRQGRSDPVALEEFSDDPVTAGGMGYGRSKWVVEKVLERAKNVGARVGVLRIGQLVGDTDKGVWNETEAWPLLFKSANTIGALPVLEERPWWLPVDQAGRAISEIVLSTLILPELNQPHAQVYHVLNARVAQWSDILKGLQEGGLKFEPVSRREWLDRLAKSDPDVVKNPTYKLLNFYQNRMGAETERAHMDFAVEKTSKVSPTIAACRPIDPALVALWVSQWKKSGFLQ